MKRTINWLPALFGLVFGGVFLFASFLIPESFSGGHGNRVMPMVTSLIVVLISGWLLFRQTVLNVSESHEPGNEDIELHEFCYRAAPLIVLIGVYGYFQIWFGYILATLCCGVVAFRLFNNSWLASLVHTIAGTVVLYFLFFLVLKLYEPPGSLIDLSGLI